MYIPPNRRGMSAKVQAPYVLAEIRALRSSLFKKTPEVKAALAIADRVEQTYDLTRTDLFLPVPETMNAIIEPLATSVFTGTLREIGYEMFPQYLSILNIPRANAKATLGLATPDDLIRFVCDAYSKSVIGSDAGALEPSTAGSTTTVTDTSVVPCELNMGVFTGAGQVTGLFRSNVVTERRCRANGNHACSYDFAF